MAGYEDQEKFTCTWELIRLGNSFHVAKVSLKKILQIFSQVYGGNDEDVLHHHYYHHH